MKTTCANITRTIITSSNYFQSKFKYFSSLFFNLLIKTSQLVLVFPHYPMYFYSLLD